MITIIVLVHIPFGVFGRNDSAAFMTADIVAVKAGLAQRIVRAAPVVGPEQIAAAMRTGNGMGLSAIRAQNPIPHGKAFRGRHHRAA